MTDSDTAVIFGWHTVAAALEQTPERIKKLWLLAQRRDARSNALIQQAAQHRIPVKRASRSELEQLSHYAHHQGIVAELTRPAPRYREADLNSLLKTSPSPPLLLILDGVQDPHNLGACLRTADGAGANAVIAPGTGAVGLTAAVHKVSSGASTRLPFIQVSNLARALRQLRQRGVWLVGASEAAARSYYEADLCGPCALLLGAEGKGLRRLTKDHCDYLVSIPMAGSVGSLNVSVAAGILLYEAVRQRRQALSASTIFSSS